MKPLNEDFVLKGHFESLECRSRLLGCFSVSGCTVAMNQRASIKAKYLSKTRNKNIKFPFFMDF